ncbi:MAG: CHAT domain-containing protein [Halothece sp. Uz-M2-17]|nr:CHAT domain-containing protein [Halothece sp. Uz-M2-17]
MLKLLPKNPLTRWLLLTFMISLTPLSLQPIATTQITEENASSPSLSEKILGMERGLEQEFETYFDRNLAEVTQPPEEIARTLSRLSEETGSRSAVLWAIPRETHLHLVLITPDGDPIVRDLYDVPRSVLDTVTEEFHRDLINPLSPMKLEIAQQLHQWIIEPYEDNFLQAEGIETILFCLGDGLRGLPLAALHDGEQFLIEKYSLSRIPAFNLINTNYDPLELDQVLVTGASEFPEQVPLPAVPMEMWVIGRELRNHNQESDNYTQGQYFFNERFTQENLQNSLANTPFDIVHLATHAEFQQGDPNNSYIQFWDSQLTLDNVSELNWNNPPVELLVLSACETALGDEEAELGFAGLTLQSGVKSAVASLWYVSDSGTLALMSEFYQQLAMGKGKAEALRQAQIQMLRGNVHLTQDNLVLSRGALNLPSNWESLGRKDFSHPFYWGSFTVIGNPW